MSVIHYGPWVGEFGVELIWWTPTIRVLAQKDHANGDTVVVSAPSNSKWLYEFADDFIPLEWDSIRCDGIKGAGKTVPVKADKHVNGQGLCDISQRSPGCQPREHRFLGDEPSSSSPDVMVAFRPEKLRDWESKLDNNVQGKAYPPEMCKALVAEFESRNLSVGSFGGPDNWHFGSGPDYRGRPLREQCSLLAGAKCAVGPSSGTMHLANVCKVPYVTWYTQNPSGSENVHKRKWRVFDSEITCLLNCPPNPQEVVNAVEHLINT